VIFKGVPADVCENCGERSAASPVVNNRRQVTLVFRET